MINIVSVIYSVRCSQKTGITWNCIYHCIQTAQNKDYGWNMGGQLSAYDETVRIPYIVFIVMI